ncbi:MAG: 50S ribosomal protein L10 [Mariprofundaceae bacterium]
MDRMEKQQAVEQLHEAWSTAKAGIITHYRGLNVDQLSGLRRKLREGQASFKVVKNSLARRAVVETDFSVAEELFTGPTAVIYGEDPVGMAKAVSDFSKEHEALEIRGGILDGKLIDQSVIKALALLPSREVLLARLLGGLNAPISGFVRTLAEVPASFVRTLAAIRDQKEETA